MSMHEEDYKAGGEKALQWIKDHPLVLGGVALVIVGIVVGAKLFGG